MAKTPSLESIKRHLRAATEFKREMPAMTDGEQADMIRAYLAEDADQQRQDIINANTGTGMLELPAKLAYSLCCQTVTVFTIYRFVKLLSIIYRIPPLKLFCDPTGAGMKEAGQIMYKVDRLMTNPRWASDADIDNVAEYIYDIPDKIKHIRIRLMAAVIVAVDVAAIIITALLL